MENPITLVALDTRKYASLIELLRSSSAQAGTECVSVLDYPVHARPRWTGAQPHPQLHALLNAHRDQYRVRLESFLELSDLLAAIPAHPAEGYPAEQPFYVNGWVPGLDSVALYGFMSASRPKLFLEVGSGNTTKFARRAISDLGLDTRIVSIDPMPRAEIDSICDEVVREPVEDVDLSVFDQLQAGDILYVDNSHRTLMNSDATTMFLDVLPRLAPGVLVEFHDIMLPADYPEAWISRCYSEQYLLAAWLLAGGERVEILLPNAFISRDPELNQVLKPLWQRQGMEDVEQHGCSFWLRTR